MSTETVEPIQVKEETISRYFSLIEKEGRIPSLFSIDVLKPIPLNKGEQVLEPQTYFFIFDTDYLEDQSPIPPDALDTPLFTLESHNILPNGKLDPIMITTGNKQAPLTFLEAIVWAAFNDAKEAGDTEQANKIYNTAFAKNEECDTSHTVSGMKEKTDIQAENGLSDSEPTLFGMDTSKNIPIQGTIKPRTQIDPNSKLAQTITMLELGKTISLDVSGGNEKPKSVLTDITLTYEGEGIKLSKQLSEFDREIHNTVATLIHAGNMAFTPRQVWHTLTGSENPPSKAQLSRIEESLDKQRFIRAYVDFSAEARGRNLTLDGEPVESYVIDTYLLNLDKGTIQTANGRKVEGYTVNKLPVLYQHSAALGQVITYPMRMLKASGNTVQNTEENIIIRKYLLRRIGMAKGKRKISPRIKYSSVYEKVGIKNPNKKQRKRINDTVLQILETLKKEKHIKGYEEYKEGRTRAGVDLIL